MKIGEEELINRIAELENEVSRLTALATQSEHNEARLRAVMESTSEVIGLLDKQGVILDANEAFGKLLEKNRIDLLGQNVFKLISKEISEQLKLDAAKVVLSGQPFRGVDCTRSRWLEYVVNPINIKSQSPDHFALFMKDITESKKAVEETRSIIQRYESLMKTASDGIHVLDQDGKIMEVSDSFCQMLGYSREELLTMKVTDIDEEKDSDEIKKNIDKSFYQPLLFPARHKRKDGSLLEVEVSISAIAIGGQTYCYASSRDITERLITEKALLKSEAQLRNLNATKDKFFSIIGHDLRSPFNAILGFSNLMVEQIKTNDFSDIAEYAEIIAKSTERAVNLLNNLMEWSRTQTDRITFQAEYVDIIPIVKDVVYLMQESANQKSIHISIVSPDYLCTLVDKSMFHTILRNILSNAIKFTCGYGQVAIKVSIDTPEVLISVSDNGIGLSQENLNNLFRIEEIYSTPGTQNEKGTGLGLVLCKEFVEKHKGRIWAESTLGKGSTFYFTIPVQ